ncbi:hypothetical protein BB559_002017 [Furculomyces boomerangus]|uniref:Uncharacterized protein n=2 Tax=Harpellales TaxID=61421 RepID=A0A2T9YYQ8_9FUNG|nr:hypothetical protein BB559_002017 [Furculomyces boomerangus]PWA03118.1 hypothetical protein BB558_000710 [Smittium angustum]
MDEYQDYNPRFADRNGGGGSMITGYTNSPYGGYQQHQHNQYQRQTQGFYGNPPNEVINMEPIQEPYPVYYPQNKQAHPKHRVSSRTEHVQRGQSKLLFIRVVLRSLYKTFD